MKLKRKNATRENVQKITEKEGIIGSKRIEDIKKLKTEDKLLEAFFSVLAHVQWQLQSNFHNKFHINWKDVHLKKKQNRDITELWNIFTEKVDNLFTIIFISYSTDLINKSIFQKLDKIRVLRNQIAHNLLYYEPEIFVTRKEVRSAIDDCIIILDELGKIEHEIVFGRK